MKASALMKLLSGVDPETEVYIDLGISYDKRGPLIFEMLTDEDFTCSKIEHIDVVCNSEGVSEIYLCPYDGIYSLENNAYVESYFKEHNLEIL